MELITKADSFDEYLEVSEYINHNHIKVAYLSNYFMETIMKDLSEGKAMEYMDPEMEFASRAFRFVRDEISHSNDAGRKELCLRASDVLDKRTGLCFGKSHLLCALLRAAGIPSGLCYQYLRLDENDEDSPLILHGLTAIYFESLGKWIRVDARGNKPGVTAEFSVEEEKLAFPVRPGLGETDLPFIFPRPDIGVIGKLLLSKTAQEAMANLPDRIAGKC
ncbi:MAG: transglutaminase domain-containing protein [Clostridiales bacterium]|nr:transglutaminase domain-containing protein [Clostridiales bacterium]MBQ6270612.1 transglutaminase domain-containing protein [Clostridiales bacterium]